MRKLTKFSTTAEGCRVTETVAKGETVIVLESPKATVTKLPTKPAKLEWLMRDVMSTDWATCL